MARRFFGAATSPDSGAHTGPNSTNNPSMSPSAYKDGVKATGPHRRKKSARIKHHSKRRG
jgi:hypothetical protein